MLVRLFGKNFRSLKEDFELSLVAADFTRKDDLGRGIIETPLKGSNEPLRLLRGVAIFGPNASGKSTVLTAGRALQWLCTESSRRSQPDAPIPPYEPFLLDDVSQGSPIHLGCDVIYRKSLLRYEIVYGAKAIERESLVVMDDAEEVTLIDRKASGDVQGKLIATSDANRLYVKEIQPNVSVLSKLAQHGPHRGKESAQPYYRVIRDSLRYREYSDAAEAQINLSGGLDDDRFAGDAEYREWIMQHLIRAADVGICGVETRTEAVRLPDVIREQLETTGGGFKLPDTRTVISFVHEGKSNRPIDFFHESAGTRKLFNIAADWWTLANQSGTLLADELSASLHPRLLDRLVRAVNAPPATVKSQLIFTTHDTGLLEGHDGDPPALRRDQVYFTRKDGSGASELYSLAEFKDDARPVHNIRKRYLSGLYGAIPSVEKLSL